MKKRFIGIISLTVVCAVALVVVLCISSGSSAPKAEETVTCTDKNTGIINQNTNSEFSDVILPDVVIKDTVSVSAPVVDPVVDTSSTEGQVEQDLDMEKISKIIGLNRVYGKFISDEVSLIEEAEVVLIDKAVTIDGKVMIPCDDVDMFIKDVYGLDISSDEEYYEVLPRGYETISHNLVSADVLDNGNIRAISEMNVGYSDDEVSKLTAITVLKVNNDSAYGYNIVSADILEDLEGE